MAKNKENSSPNIRGHGIPISPQVKEIVLDIYRKGLSKGHNTADIVSDILEKTLISESSAYRIIKSPEIIQAKKRAMRRKRFEISDEDIEKIDEMINKFLDEKIIPTKKDVFKRMKLESENVISFEKCSQITFYRLLKRAGYKAKLSVKLSRQIEIQEPEIRRKRINYLKKKRELEKDPKKYRFIYVDETYIHKNYLKTRILWPLKFSKRLKYKFQLAKGNRYSVLYAGGKKGFVNGSLLITKNSELNSEKFEEWLKVQLLPNLNKPSVIVFDNASTHSRILNKGPNSNSAKKAMQEWLQTNNIPFEMKNTRKQLYEKIKEINQKHIYAVDQINENSGHIPLRTPPYCCELNPIELIWAEWKRIIGSHNLGHSDQEFLLFIKEVFNQIDENYWKRCLRHLVKVEGNFWISDNCDN